MNAEYGVEFKPCPVGAHYMHGRVERKIRHVRESLSRSLEGKKLSSIGNVLLEFNTPLNFCNSVNNSELFTINFMFYLFC